MNRVTHDEDPEPAPARRGRPRDPAVEDRVLSATLELLGSEGFDGTTLDAIAAAAGVTKPTLYRRWRNKEDLATAAVATLADSDVVAPTDDPWDDLLTELRLFGEAVGRPNGMAFIGTLLAEETRTPDLLDMFRERVVTQRRGRIISAISRLRDVGEVHLDADPSDISNMLLGYFYSAYIGGQRLDPQWPERCVSLLRNGIGAAPATRNVRRRNNRHG